MAKLTYADIKKKKKPLFQRVPIALDGDKADEFNAARARVDELEAQLAELNDKATRSALVDAKNKLEELRSEMEDNVVVFVFRAIGRPAFEDLTAEHPPTKKQKDEAEKKGAEEPAWNSETFPPALVAAALVEPKLTEEEVLEIWNSDNWNDAELMALFLAAFNVNQNRKVVDLGKDSAQTPA